MGDVRNEPSMEDILASIKRIIAEDGAAVATPRARPQPRMQRAGFVPEEPAPEEPAPAAPEEAVLELTDAVPEPPAALLVSADAANASRQSLAALSAVVVRPDSEAETRPDNTLEGLVREMLRPMLKDWLDSRLPELVEGLVAREIARITGKPL